MMIGIFLLSKKQAQKQDKTKNSAYFNMVTGAINFG